MIVFKDKIQIAKKKHICNFCINIINIGEKYFYQTGINDGFYVWKSHISCNELSHKLNMYEDAYDEGVSSDLFQESITEAYKSITGNNKEGLPEFSVRLEFVSKHYLNH